MESQSDWGAKGKRKMDRLISYRDILDLATEHGFDVNTDNQGQIILYTNRMVQLPTKEDSLFGGVHSGGIRSNLE